MRLMGLKNELMCHFELAANVVRDFVFDRDGPAFLERELMGLGVGGYR